MDARRPACAPPIDRAQFPMLERRIGRDGDRPLVYLDSAATSLVPLRVTDAVTRFLHTSCANIHRGAHVLAEEATDAYECARERLAALVVLEQRRALARVHRAMEPRVEQRHLLGLDERHAHRLAARDGRVHERVRL